MSALHEPMPNASAKPEGGSKRTGWLSQGGRWYWLDSSGAAAENAWRRVNGSWYHFDGGCRMQTGWYKAGGRWYYSYSSGAMARDTWVGRYCVNGSGAWSRSR